MLQLVPGGFLRSGDVGLFSSVNVIDEAIGYQIDGTSILWTGDTANYNMFLGEDAFDNDEGRFNVGIGYQAGYFNDNSAGSPYGEYNVYVGYYAGRGHVDGSEGYGNIGVGSGALASVRDGQANVALGSSALNRVIDGNGNIAIGGNMQRLISGSWNMGLGAQALNENKTGSNNVAIGRLAGQGVRDGSDVSNDTFIGFRSGNKILTGGDSNVFIGYYSGYRQTVNHDLLIIDNQDRGSAANEATMALIYGLFAAAAADQDLTFNANVFLSQVKAGASQAAAGAAAGEIWRWIEEGWPEQALMMGL